jgi:hypothetical protein
MSDRARYVSRSRGTLFRRQRRRTSEELTYFLLKALTLLKLLHARIDSRPRFRPLDRRHSGLGRASRCL